MKTDIRLYVAERARISYVREALRHAQDFLEDVVGDKTLNVVATFSIPDSLVRKHCDITVINGEEFVYPTHRPFHIHSIKEHLERNEFNIPMGCVFYGRRLANRVDQKIDDWELVKSRKLDENHIEIYGIVSGEMYPTVTTFHENSYYSFPHEIGHILLSLKDHGGRECLMHPPARGEKFSETKLCNDCLKDIRIKDKTMRLSEENRTGFYKLISKDILDEMDLIKKINL